MSTAFRKALVTAPLFAALLIFAPAPLNAQKTSAPAVIDLTPVAPESVGFSSERLERLHSFIQAAVDKKELAGAVTILARHGKIVDYRTYGVRDLASGAPMTKDTIFRDYSMTKPVTGVAMLMLYEQGKWLPSDPISKFIPEFANLKVFAGLDSTGKMILVNPSHAPTMLELMTHTAGFSYGDGDGPVDDLYQKLNIRHATTFKQTIDGLAQAPLNYQPGTQSAPAWRQTQHGVRDAPAGLPGPGRSGEVAPAKPDGLNSNCISPPAGPIHLLSARCTASAIDNFRRD